MKKRTGIPPPPPNSPPPVDMNPSEQSEHQDDNTAGWERMWGIESRGGGWIKSWTNVNRSTYTAASVQSDLKEQFGLFVPKLKTDKNLIATLICSQSIRIKLSSASHKPVAGLKPNCYLLL